MNVTPPIMIDRIDGQQNEAIRLALCKRNTADQQAGDAPEAVEEGNHLRHGGHRHQAGCEAADHRADNHAEEDPAIIDNGMVQKRYDHREQHSQGGEGVAPSRRFRMAEKLQAEDKEYGSDRVAQVDQHDAGHDFPAPFFLNMASIRSVTR